MSASASPDQEAYRGELGRFDESGGTDAGEVWFGEDTQATMVSFVCETVASETAAGRGPGEARAAWRGVDLGCGNGALTVALAKEGCGAKTT